MSLTSLLKKTGAYQIISGDKKNNTLSHAYLIVCHDKKMLLEYGKFFAKLIMCKSESLCDECRICHNIDKKAYSDCVFYPLEEKLSVDDIDDLIGKSSLRPFEDDKKLFVIIGADEMNVQSQNKLLKTLEEPTETSSLLLIATSEEPLLVTVKSRVKKIELSPFSEEDLKSELLENFEEEEKFDLAVSMCGGCVGKLVDYYEDGKGLETEKLVLNILKNMKSSGDIVKYSSLVTKENISEFLSVLRLALKDILSVIEGREKYVKRNASEIKGIASSFTRGTVVFAEEKINFAERALYFNGNVSMLAEGVLFGILEGKHKWQK